LNQGDVLSPFLFNIAVENVITEFQANQEGFKINGTYYLLINDREVIKFFSPTHALFYTILYSLLSYVKIP
jgi:hypothetical protein